jgi:type IV pilus biogenesis protein CpaD/CtpE
MHENIYRGRGYRWVLAAVLMAMLCGCGDDDEEKTSSIPAGSSPPPAPAPDPAPPPTSQARAATVEWTAPTTQTNGATLADLAGYRIHYGLSANALTQTIEIKNPSVSTYVVEGLAPGTYYFAITAFSSRNLESERSNAGMKQIL